MSSLQDLGNTLLLHFAKADLPRHMLLPYSKVKKGKGFPYSLPSIGPEADPGVQAVSPQSSIRR